jgi:hypothetical protein
MHGGCSTGPKTAAGLRRSQKARWKTGKYSRNSKKAYKDAMFVGELYRRRGMWLSYLGILKEGDKFTGTKRRKKSRTTRLEGTISALLEAGVRGAGLAEMRRIGLKYPND